MSSPDFRLTWLWRHAFVNPLPDVSTDEQNYFRDRYLEMRERASMLVAQIANSIPGLTVHDLSHLDSLWDTASLASDGAISINPAEAFVFGASVLIHDSAMTLAAYPNGLDDLKKTVEWRDFVVALVGAENQTECIIDNPPPDICEKAVAHVLRVLHASQSERLATQGWISVNSERLHLIEDSDLRYFYGSCIGRIAHSHWWPTSRIEEELSQDLGAMATRTRCLVDKAKVACLLRVADALNIDQRRAPRFLRTLIKPNGLSALHWAFQERLALPHIEHESVVFTSGADFPIEDADAWWLAYDTICDIDRELREVDLLMQNRGRGIFRARQVKGAGSPESLARTVQPKGWRPVDTKLKVSDIPKVVETLGGAKLYGDDPTIPIRELIQNSADAIQARRRIQNRPHGWGEVKVKICSNGNEHWLTVEDNGIGMSEQVLTGPLIDFGSSFWRSSLATQEFPGLVSSGMSAIGRFGIGFFSVFMIGSVVRVISRRYDKGVDFSRVLEFRNGTTSRPILSPAKPGEAPIDGGTRVEILLKHDPHTNKGILNSRNYNSSILKIEQLIGAIAPSVDVSVMVGENQDMSSAVSAGDWLTISESELMVRINPLNKVKSDSKKPSRPKSIQEIFDDSGSPLGRVRIRPNNSFSADGGWVTLGGLRASRLANVEGLLVGKTTTASRNSALPQVSLEKLSEWASEQAVIISNSNFEESYKAKCAEVVLECGGDVGGLPLICLGVSHWLNADQLRERLNQEQEFLVGFDGEFSYEEDFDDVHPRDFKGCFEVATNIAIVPKHDGTIISFGSQTWPRMITGKQLKWGESNLSLFVRKVLSDEWEDYSEYNEDIVVGSVLNTEIRREITKFTKVC